MRARSSKAFYLFISPWLIGFFGLTLIPLVVSFYTSFTEWDGINGARFVGTSNYKQMFTQDPLFYKSIVNTFYYAVGSVVLGVILALILAVLVNQKIPGKSIFRVIFFLPYVVTGIPVYVIWTWLFNPQEGLFNYILGLFGIHGPQWLNSTHWAMPSLILMSLTGVGGMMVVFLSGLQGIPEEIYEAARIDGAGSVVQLLKITVPMLSPVILFNTIWGIIGALQVFAQPYVMTNGGPINATMVFGLYLYRMAFTYFKFGYASALAWVLFIITLALSLMVFGFMRKRVHYTGGAV